MKIFKIFGNPLSHTLSPQMHNSAFLSLKLDANYSKCQLENGDKIREIFLEKNLSGANITVPFKEKAFYQCDEVRGIAKKIGAVNTLIKQDNKVIGFNTDAPGFMMSIKEFLPIKSALILGAGGTAKAISYALKEKNINVQILNRSAQRLQSFNDFTTFTWENFAPKPYDIIINTTSAGLKDENLPAPKEIILPILKLTKYSFDVIYHKQTPFIKLSKELNIPHKNGKDMLLYQGVLAFELFTNLKVTDDIIKTMKMELNR